MVEVEADDEEEVETEADVEAILFEAIEEEVDVAMPDPTRGEKGEEDQS